MKEADNDWQPR